MRVYTVHVRRDATPGDASAFDEAILVRDGFTFPAFLFTALWFFFHRLWIAGLGVLLAVIAFGFLIDALALAPLAAFGAHLLLASLIGLEASSLRRWTYARNGMPAVDIVAGIDYEEAEAKACARWLARRRAPEAASQVQRDPAADGLLAARPARAPAAPAPRERDVIGLFPERSR